MQQKILSFQVDDQFIRAPHYKVVSDSKNYLAARFSFSECWQGLTKTAVFQGADGNVYHMMLTDDTCIIPAEVIQPTRFLVSVFGGDRMTTDRVTVEVEASGCVEGVTPPAPTPDVYAQLVETVSTERQLAQAAAVAAGEKTDICLAAQDFALTQAQTAVAFAQTSVDAAEQSAARANEASFYYDQARESAATAERFASSATIDSQTASVCAQNAEMAREQAVAQAEAASLSREEATQAAGEALQSADIATRAAEEVATALDWKVLAEGELTEENVALIVAPLPENFTEYARLQLHVAIAQPAVESSVTGKVTVRFADVTGGDWGAMIIYNAAFSHKDAATYQLLCMMDLFDTDEENIRALAHYKSPTKYDGANATGTANSTLVSIKKEKMLAKPAHLHISITGLPFGAGTKYILKGCA